MKYQPTSATPQRPAITPPSGVRGVEVPTYRRNTRRIDAFLTLFLLSAAASLQGQLLRPDDYLPIERLPRAVQSYQQVLGDRLRVPGKERVISSRTLTDSRGTSSAILSWELPGRLRLDRPGSASRVLQAGASGLAITSAQANLSEEEENLVDSLLHDRLETFLINAAKGQLVRLVAQNVRATRDLSPNYAGPLPSSTVASSCKATAFLPSARRSKLRRADASSTAMPSSPPDSSMRTRIWSLAGSLRLWANGAWRSRIGS